MVVVMLARFRIVMGGGAAGHVGFGAGIHAQQHIDRQPAHGAAHDLHAVAGLFAQPCDQMVGFCLFQQVGLVHDNQVGAGDLVVIQLRQGRFMVEHLVGLALGIDGSRVMGEKPLGHGLAVNHRHHAIDGDAGADLGPVEGAHQGLRQGQPRGLDHDVVRGVAAGQQLFHGGDEFLGHRAADAAIGQFGDVLVAAGGIAAPL